MEYEIQDGEAALFDDSTNPSLQPERCEGRQLSPANPHGPAAKRELQHAELIPEEEHQLA